MRRTVCDICGAVTGSADHIPVRLAMTCKPGDTHMHAWDLCLGCMKTAWEAIDGVCTYARAISHVSDEDNGSHPGHVIEKTVNGLAEDLARVNE